LQDTPRFRRGICIVFAPVLFISFLGAFAVFVPGAAAQGSNPDTTGSWTQTVDYGSGTDSSGRTGVQIQGNSCVEYQSTLYCVGGENLGGGSATSAVYYDYVLPSGAVGAWFETTDYGAISGSAGHGGLGVEWPSCVAYLGYIYCVAGLASGSPTSKVYYAQLQPNGVGPWTETTDYAAASGDSGSGGTPTYQLSCVPDSGYVYCVGGAYPTSKTYVAQLSSSGVGPWTETTDYGAQSTSSGIAGVAIAGTSCADALGYVFCMGGEVQFSPVSDVFYAPLNGVTGIGPWTETTDYGATAGYTGSGGLVVYGVSCTSYGPSIFCVAGQTKGNVGTADVFSAQDPPTIPLSWTNATGYPLAGDWKSCANNGSAVTCVGGGVSDVYYAPITTASTTSSTNLATSTTNSTTSAITSTVSSSTSSITTSSSSATSSTATAAQSTTSSTVPEFPGEALTLTLMFVFLALALLIGNKGKGHKGGAYRR